MTDKAYIVANKQQELDILNRLENQGLVWISGNKPTEQITSESSFFDISIGFPYALVERKGISWSLITELAGKTIVYDGRKEEKVDKMYKVTQEFMNELIKWRDIYDLDARTSWTYAFVDGSSISEFPEVVEDWCFDLKDPIENNNRLIAIIKWLNGEDVFEVEKPHKFVVRSERADKYGDYNYVKVVDHIALSTDFQYAMTFDTREEAQEWANSHQVVVEID